jgi:hypothetical protein
MNFAKKMLFGPKNLNDVYFIEMKSRNYVINIAQVRERIL